MYRGHVAETQPLSSYLSCVQAPGRLVYSQHTGISAGNGHTLLKRYNPVRLAQELQGNVLVVSMAGGLLGRYKQPNGGLLGLAAGVMAVMATVSLTNQVLCGSRFGAGSSLAWACAGALAAWLTWRHYQVLMPMMPPPLVTDLTKSGALRFHLVFGVARAVLCSVPVKLRAVNSTSFSIDGMIPENTPGRTHVCTDAHVPMLCWGANSMASEHLSLTMFTI